MAVWFAMPICAQSTLKPRWDASVTPAQKAVLEKLISNMVKVEGGTFTMGATAEQGNDAYSGEKPTHRVTLSNFCIGKYEVTQEEWQAVMGRNPSSFKGNNKPVESINRDNCLTFIHKLNKLTGLNFSLPTEAQWEYAARGGNRSQGYKYSGSNNISNVGWCDGNRTHEVGTKQPNELGLYDMSGNVYEWCYDWGGPYDSDSQTNPKGPDSRSRLARKNPGTGKPFGVLRGGCYYHDARSCRVSARYIFSSDYNNEWFGLRLALNVTE